MIHAPYMYTKKWSISEQVYRGKVLRHRSCYKLFLTWLLMTRFRETPLCPRVIYTLVSTVKIQLIQYLYFLHVCTHYVYVSSLLLHGVMRTKFTVIVTEALFNFTWNQHRQITLTGLCLIRYQTGTVRSTQAWHRPVDRVATSRRSNITSTCN